MHPPNIYISGDCRQTVKCLAKPHTADKEEKKKKKEMGFVMRVEVEFIYPAKMEI